MAARLNQRPARVLSAAQQGRHERPCWAPFRQLRPQSVHEALGVQPTYQLLGLMPLELMKLQPPEQAQYWP